LYKFKDAVVREMAMVRMISVHKQCEREKFLPSIGKNIGKVFVIP
jgi:hypothetical protein